jgi:sugar phosphate isomerase/epimerase
MGRSLGIAAFEFKAPLREAFQRTVSHGVRHCELVTPGDVTRASLSEASDLAAEFGMQVTAVASLTRLNSADDVSATIALLDESVDIAAGLGAPAVITYFGGHPERRPRDAIERYAKLIQPTLDRARARGVSVLIENHFSHAPGEVTNSAEGCAELISAVDADNFGLNFDHCNFAIGGQDIVAAYEQLRPLIRNIHVKDARPFDPATDAGYDGRVVTDLVRGEFLFVPVADGITDNDAILGRVVADKLEAPVTVEVHVPDRMVDATFTRGIAFCRDRGI